MKSVHAVTVFSAAVNTKQEYLISARTRGGNHTFGKTEFHLAGFEVGNQDHLAANQRGRILVGSLKSREDMAFGKADIYLEA